jgi:hypothetical protein
VNALHRAGVRHADDDGEKPHAQQKGYDLSAT